MSSTFISRILTSSSVCIFYRVNIDIKISEGLAALIKQINIVGNKVFTKASGASKPQKQPVASTPEKKTEPALKVPEVIIPIEKKQAPSVKKLETVSVPKPKEPPKVGGSNSIGFMENQDLLKQAAVIVSVLDQYKDIWISRKENGSINIEQMDGKICTFKVEGGKISYAAGSFTEIPSEKRNSIETLIKELL